MNAPAGIGLQLCATFFFAIMSALVRVVAQDVPSGQIVFTRSLFGLIPVAVWIAWNGRMGTALITRTPLGHVVRGLVGVTAMWMAFAALAFIPLAEAIAFSYATPLVTVVLAAILLGERVPAHRWEVLMVGLAGILLMLWPSFSHATPGASRAPLIGAALALAGAVGAGFAITQVRHLTRTETSEAIVFYFSLVAALAGLVTAPFGWVIPDGATALVLVGMGLAGGVGQICMTAANRYAPASLVAPLNYATLLWATGFGIFIFGEWPDPLVAAGAGVVVVAGLALIWRERPGERRARTRGPGEGDSPDPNNAASQKENSEQSTGGASLPNGADASDEGTTVNQGLSPKAASGWR
ncbi:DMT family transporter [Xanthobacter autotrophicus DSM 431]|uniref:DMT family transporter n=1 Tax=Xanthobacter nonsaccharivorans TaxID=3119912 RepID=UPI0037290756